jgi:magnesium-transporting ATPase (P-type)
MDRLYKGQNLIDQTNSYLNSFAKKGLRTLLIATKKIKEQDYREWSVKYAKAMTSTLRNKEKQINELSEFIEKDLELIGSTAIEDKLQDEVGQTIKDLKAAGI